jgi:hypothetical protein
MIAMRDAGYTVSQRDRAHLATVIGTPAEQMEARRRLAKEIDRSQTASVIRKKAGKVQMKMNKWKPIQRRIAEKQAGVRLRDGPRTTGKIYWDVNRTLGQLDDPW